MGIYDEPVIIHPSIMNRITASLGTPILDLKEDLLIDEEMIKELFIRPAMQLYFTYWPKLLKKEYPITQQVQIPFPNNNVYGIAQARVALNQNANTWSKSPFLNEVLRKQVSSYGSYGVQPGTRRDPYITAGTLIKEQTEQLSYISLRKAGSFTVDSDERCLEGYSNVSGILVIQWAQYFWDWNKIKFEHTEDVIKMCKVYALRFVGGIRDQSDPNTGVAIDGSSFREDADKLEEEVLINRWEGRVPVVLLH
jgi:hypothetical protein